MNKNIQGLRALAAYCVVGHHIIDSLTNYIAIGRFNHDIRTGSVGVNIFFVISGYVMMLTTARRDSRPISFIYDRIVRIAPVYWLLTILVYAAVRSGFSLFGNTDASWQHLLTSLFFSPYLGKSGKVEFPLLFPGWTLNYEMMFYLIFALCLLARNVTLRAVMIITLIIAAWSLQFWLSNILSTYLSSDIIVAFAFGIGLWMILVSKSSPKPIALCFLLFIGCFGLLSLDFPSAYRMPHEQLVVSTGAMILVYVAACLERTGNSIGSGFLCRQGDISYSLYLIHPFVIQAIGKASIKTGLNSSVSGLVFIVIIMIIFSGVAAKYFYRFVEHPIIEYFKSKRAPLAQTTSRSRPR